MEKPKLAPDNVSEIRDRRKELTEERHSNAVMAFRLEKFLSEELPDNEYPTSRTAVNREKERVVLEKLKPILDKLQQVGLISKHDRMESVAWNYITKKVMAQRSEKDLRDTIKHEGREATPQEMGKFLFRLRMGQDPVKKVEARREEGYFVMDFSGDEDYLAFIGSKKLENSSGLFHRSMPFTDVSGRTKAPPFHVNIDVLLLRSGWNIRTLEHERQHFINHSVFGSFLGFEQQVPLKSYLPTISKKARIPEGGLREENVKIGEGLDQIKDELLARIRDGSDPKNATNFFSTDLYSYLRDYFSVDERQEVGTLLKTIESELKNTHNIFDYPSDARAILVYHLIDIPLLKFPERIKAVADFMRIRIREFTDFIPDKVIKNTILSKDKKEQLLQLRLTITGAAYGAVDMILGVTGEEEIDTKKKLKAIKEDISLLRKKYDDLISQ